MEVTRRDLLTLMAVAASSQVVTGRSLAQELGADALTDFQSLGNVTLLHVTDTHAALLPVYYREPDSLYGVGDEAGHSPFITGEALLNHYGFAAGSLEAHAFTPIDFVDLAQRFGRFGGYAQIATLVKQIRDERQGRVLLLDGGDTLHGSATALWTRGRDMLEVINLLGVDIFTAHWEFTYGSDTVREYFGDLEGGGLFNGQFLAQNVRDSEWYDDAFKPYVVREMGGARIGVIGQAFPYVPISHPLRLVEDLTFGIQEERLQRFVNELRDDRGVDAVVLLSHNGFSADYKLAGQVSGLDVILSGHTHDAIPVAMPVGDTLVIQSGAHGKFLGRLDLDVGDGRVRDWRFKLIPVLADHVEPDEDMANLIKSIREPFREQLGEVLAVSESLLWRRGNFNGPFDEVILDALMQHYEADVAFSPGFRWGPTIIPGQEITTEDVFTHTGLTYPNTWSREMTGAEIKHVMEDVANNLFHPDPYARQGGDMVRVGGLSYVIDPTQEMGQRIREMTLRGDPMEADRSYKVAGWAAMDEVDGPPVYDVVADYLRREGTVRIEDRNRVRLIG
jgi:S-sulfosulfanyl-L-cysteine sulfohydrolase